MTDFRLHVFMLLLAVLPCGRASAREPVAARKPVPRVDVFGDPLPTGSVSRFGSTRLLHAGVVYKVAFSSDGTRIISAANDRTACVWDASTGKRLRRLVFRNTKQARAVKAISRDGNLVAVRTGTGDLAIWDFRTGKQRFVLRGHITNRRAVVFSPDGKWIVTGDTGARARVWNAFTGNQAALLKPHAEISRFDSAVRTLVFSRDGKRIVLGHRIYDFARRRPICVLDDSISFSSLGVAAFSADGDAFLVLRPRGIDRYDIRTKSRQRIATNRNWYWLGGATAFSGDATQLFCVSALEGNKRFRALDIKTGVVLLTSPILQDPIEAIAISPKRKRLVTGDRRGRIIIWSLPHCRKRTGPTGVSDIESLAVSPDGRLLATSAKGNKLRVWDTVAAKEVWRLVGKKIPSGDTRWGFYRLAFSLDGKSLYVACHDGVIRVWNVQTHNLLIEKRSIHRQRITGLVFSRDGKHFATSSCDGSVQVWSSSCRSLTEFRFPKGVRSIRLSPHGARLMGVLGNGALVVHAVASRRRLLKLHDPSNPITSAVFVDSGRVITLSHADGTLVIRSVDTAQEYLRRRESDGNVGPMAISDDGLLFALRSSSGRVRILEIGTGKRLAVIKHPNPSSPFPIVFAPDGRKIFTGALGGVLVWQLDEILHSTSDHSGLGNIELTYCWKNLGSDRPGVAWRALLRLANGCEPAAHFIDRRIDSLMPQTKEQVEQCLKNLDDRQFAVRAEASRQLTVLAPVARPQIEKLIAETNISPERKFRLRELLKALDNPIARTREELRMRRAIAALSMIGTPSALAVLRRVASGDPRTKSVGQARKTLKRMETTHVSQPDP